MDRSAALPRWVTRLIRRVANARVPRDGDSTLDDYRKAYRLEKARLSIKVAEWLAAGCSIDRVELRLRNLHAPARKLEAIRKLAAAIKGVQ
ncbi:hypothetical protein [Sulfuritalea hydrogenivorans]|uniref:Uncharacterized protein n=1 Tax=Sulfuritalea hydrogenivorans sk43H TaxID=1223802 RepID=W0SEN0_9PROT|nr:hypothetical protein [Sulfuritalea hydrogenivorans]BAO29387.1 hypothetical protein SUTH_01594 [Sulfuritalea hydrogenivorans sk43H]